MAEMLCVLFMIMFPMVAHAQWVKEQENEGMYEGDMILTPAQIQDVKTGIYRFGTKKNDLWPRSNDKNVYVPYEIDPNYDSRPETMKAFRAVIKRAVDTYEKYTCIRLIERTNQKAYLHFYNGKGCSSPIGYRGRENRISLKGGCWRPGTVLHEIAHSLGVYHEQARPDRDNYVTIQWNNIPASRQHNFKKKTTATVDSLGTAYDYDSMMHYSAKAFGNGKITIKTLDESKQWVIGQRKAFSKIDIIQLNKLYCGASSRKTTEDEGCTETDINPHCDLLKMFCKTNRVKKICRKTCLC